MARWHLYFWYLPLIIKRFCLITKLKLLSPTLWTEKVKKNSLKLKSFETIYHIKRFQDCFRIFPDLLQTFKSSNLQIFRFQLIEWYFTYQIWYDDFLSWKFIQFPDFFPDFPGFSSNLQISMVLTIFLEIIDSLFIKYDMMILFSGNYAVFGFSLFFLNP